MVGRVAHLSSPPLVSFPSFHPRIICVPARPLGERWCLRGNRFSRPFVFIRLTNAFCHLLAHIDFYFHYFHALTHSFSRNPFLFTSIQNLGDVGPKSQKPPRFSLRPQCRRLPRPCRGGKFILFTHLPPLCPLFPPPVLCFQQLAASFLKTPWVGGGPHLHQRSLHRRLTRP
jgi:hypothetical protein